MPYSHSTSFGSTSSYSNTAASPRDNVASKAAVGRTTTSAQNSICEISRNGVFVWKYPENASGSWFTLEIHGKPNKNRGSYSYGITIPTMETIITVTSIMHMKPALIFMVATVLILISTNRGDNRHHRHHHHRRRHHHHRHHHHHHHHHHHRHHLYHQHRQKSQSKSPIWVCLNIGCPKILWPSFSYEHLELSWSDTPNHPSHGWPLLSIETPGDLGVPIWGKHHIYPLII